MPAEQPRCRFRALPGALALLVLVGLLLFAAPKVGRSEIEAPPGPHPNIEGVQDLLTLEIPEEEGFRVVSISAAASYALFASRGVRNTVLEGLPPDLLESGGTALGLTLPADALAAAYATAPAAGGPAGAFRDALADAGLLAEDPLTEDGLRRVLITMVQSRDLGAMYDFEISGHMQAITDRGENLRRGRGSTTTETNALLVMEQDHPTVALFETWRFDDLSDLLDREGKGAEGEEELLQARRAGLRLEAVNALYLADPEFETAVIDWIQSRLSQEEINLLAQLLQIAGFEQITPQVLVTQSAPHLFDASVLVAKLYQRFGLLTTPAGSQGLRRLDADRFADKATLGRAEAFYARFFVATGKHRFRMELQPEIGEFIGRLSAEVRSLSRPHLVRLLGGDFELGLDRERSG